jgi:hypothetical protein
LAIGAEEINFVLAKLEIFDVIWCANHGVAEAKAERIRPSAAGEFVASAPAIEELR